MPLVRTRSVLHALSQIKDVRRLLAETEYLRRLRQQRHCEQECISHSRRLAHCESALPGQRAAILDALAERPVGTRQIHDAQSALRKLQHQLNSEKSTHERLENAYRQARLDQEAARRNYAAAMHRHQKFQEIKVRDDTLATEQCNAAEQAELEDRPTPRTGPR